MAAKRSFPFFPRDWLNDPRLLSCSLAAKGLWIELLCIMFGSDEPGVLILAGQVITADKIPEIVRGNSEEIHAAFVELRAKGITQTRQDGAVYSKRMKRYCDLLATRGQAGKRGGNKRHFLTPAFLQDALGLFQYDDAIQAAWRSWVQHRSEKGKPMTTRSANASIKQIRKLGNERASAAIQWSIASGYQGLFEPGGKQPDDSAARPRIEGKYPK